MSTEYECPNCTAEWTNDPRVGDAKLVDVDELQTTIIHHSNERGKLEKEIERLRKAAAQKHDLVDVWRVGRKVGRTIYMNDKLVGMMDTPELANHIVNLLNEFANKGEG